MTDDAREGAPLAESPTEPTPVATPEPTPTSVEPVPAVEQTPPREPASGITIELPTSESKVEPPEVAVPALEAEPASQNMASTPEQQAPAAKSQSAPIPKWSASDRVRATLKRASKKETLLARVVALAKEKRRITNDDIEKLLHVSDATASRYGTILVKRGLLRREGKGRGAFYVAAV